MKGEIFTTNAKKAKIELSKKSPLKPKIYD
jgi:hypothetical protein